MKEKEKPLDSFFREALEDHEITPSKKARKKFLEEADSLARRPSLAYYLRWWFPALLFIGLTTAGVIWFSGDNNDPVRSDKKNIENTTEAVGRPLKNTNISSIENNNNEKTTIESENQKLPYQKNISHPESKSLKTELSGNTISPTYEIEDSPLKASDETNNQEEIFDLQKSQTDDNTAAGNMTNTPVEHSEDPVSDKINSTDENQDKDNEHKKQNHGKTGPLSFNMGVYYSPEWLFNISDNEGKLINDFGLQAGFRFHNYYIGTGAGISLHNGSNQYLITTNKFEGSYSKLENIEFTYDPSTWSYIPNIVVTSENVYDTAVTETYTKINSSYVYLQIPLILGYDFYHSDRFDLGIQAGPVLSVLLSEKEPSFDFDPGKDRIIQINSITPERISTNWQISGGINLRWKPVKPLVLELQPFCRYYFNSVYEKNDGSEKPWSAGIRLLISADF